MLFLAAVINIAAQEKVVLETAPPPASWPSETVKKEGNATWSYTPKKDESVVFIKKLNLSAPDIRWGDLGSSFKFKGKTFTKPDTINLSAVLASPSRTYVDDLTFIIYTDDRVLFKGKSNLSDGRTNGREVYSSITLPLSLKDFKKLAKAKKLKFQIGPTIFEIPESGDTAFGNLLKIIEDAS